MNHSKHFLFFLILILFVLGHRRPPAVAQATSVIISDGMFNPADWSIYKVESVAGTSHTVQQSTIGGNPDAFRSMTHTLPPVASGDLAEIGVTHLYDGSIYDPDLQGAIDHIDYTEDGKMLSLPWPDAHSIAQLALVQDGRLYLSNNFITFIGNTTWLSDTLTNLTASDFTAQDGSGDRPDFSASGGVIQFGYTRRNTRTETLPPVPIGQDLVYEHGIDNWTVTVYPEGAPPANSAPVARGDLVIIEPRAIITIPVLDNDSDPDGDRLSISAHTHPQHGTLFSFTDFFQYFHSFGGDFVDSFTYTITDGQLKATADVLILVDCGCTLACVSGSQSAVPQDPSLMNSMLSRLSNFLGHGPTRLQRDMIDLPLIYRLRDQVMKPTLHGNRYVNMYYKTNPEILKILLIDSPALRAESVAAVELWQETLRNLVDGDGSAVITQGQIDAIDSFLNNLYVEASPKLKQIIDEERSRLGPPEDYVGLTVKEAKSKAIGDPAVYLPLVSGQ